ncbi:MAG: sulfotransferase [Deltaproteobacteria bacterium]|nr:sulfotransferase [Deltaproteobacteria bacterium]
MRATSTDYRRPYRPRALAWLNRALDAGESLGFGRADLRADSLLGAARERTGLRELGESSLPERLRRLVDAIEAEAELHPLGRWMIRERLIGTLGNRLRMEEALRRRPAILDERIAAPVFIVGLQRTGTTVLHRMLAADPGRRFLPSWEAVSIAPAAGSPWRRLLIGDQRMALARFAEAAVRYMAPDFFAIHPVEASAPEEDVLLFDYGLWSTVPEAMMMVPSFSRWLEEQDDGPSYADYRRVLAYLQWQRPGGPWVLKTPHHMEHLETLLATFPDARIVQTHRDPATVLASFCSMMAHSRGVFSDRVDPGDVGRHWLGKAQRMVACTMRVRGAASDRGRFLDVRYGDLVADPVREIRRVYDWLGAPLLPAAEAAMERWRLGNPQYKHGRHRYRLEDFGLDREEVSRAFFAYRERFGIPAS